MKHVWVLLLLIAVSACKTPPVPPEQTSENQSKDQFFQTGKDFAGAHILVAHKDSSRASSDITRTKEEALLKAQQLIERLAAEPEIFEALAISDSDGPSAPNGGSLGQWDKGAMVPAFDRAIEALAIGEVVSEPVETDFGYHVIRREDTKSRFYGGQVFFVACKCSPDVPATISRTRAEAKELADELAPKVNSASFEEMAVAHNDLADGPTPLSGIGEKDPLPKEIIGTLAALGFGEVSGPIELSIGYAFFKRERVVRHAGSHILVSHNESTSGSKKERSRDEALAIAKEVIEQLKANPESFAELAKEKSDGPTGPRGGDLGTWFRGNMVAAFETAMSGLEIDAITPEPVETQFGFHIIKRTAVPKEMAEL